MISPPPRSGPSARPSSAVFTSATTDVPDDEASAASSLETPVAALIARASSPEDEALEQQREAFDFVTRARAELERETNALRDLAMEQMKHDDELLKKWIELI